MEEEEGRGEEGMYHFYLTVRRKKLKICREDGRGNLRSEVAVCCGFTAGYSPENESYV